MDTNNWLKDLTHEEWVAVPISGSRPSARYKQAAAVVDDKLYISGGSRNGRNLSDVQVFDLRNMTWSNLKLNLIADKDNDSKSQEALPATSGHNMIRWGKKLLLLGGNLKDSSGKLMVHYIDLETPLYGVIETSGSVPLARVGQSATLVGSRVILFGGEDMSRKLLNDVHVLDLESMTWDVIKTTQTPPAPRYDHAAAIHGDRYLLVFGGCSHSAFFNDLHILDLETMEWSLPQIQGDLASPRAGHAGVTIDDRWFIVGGGDNRSGCLETLELNMSKLVWSVLTAVKPRNPLASEGLTVCSAMIDGDMYLVAFGGYNGKYSNEVFIMRPKPRDSSHPKIFQSPAAAAAAASVTAAYALTKAENLDFKQLDGINVKPTENDHPREDVTVKIESFEKEKQVLELSLAEAKAENSKLRGEIDEVNNNTHAELSKELQSVQGQLVAERSRCFTLEAKIAELQKVVESTQSVEDEVQALRRQKSALDQEMELASARRQSSGGVWQWIGGGEK